MQMQYRFKFNIKKISSVLIVLLAYEFNLFSATYKKIAFKIIQKLEHRTGHPN